MNRKYINVLKSRNRKSIPGIIFDIFKLTIAKKELPVHYFSRLLYLKNQTSINNYLWLSDIKGISNNHFNQNAYAYLFEDKIIFNDIMTKLEIPVPKFHGFIANDKYISENNIYKLKTREAIEEILNKICLENNCDLFLKPVNGMNGRGCFSFTSSSEISLDNYSDIKNNIYVIQEKIKQHPELNKIFPNSINTIRINTIHNGVKTVHLCSVLRFGVNNREVDNGGAFISIDNNGHLVAPAYSFLEYGGNTYEKHPNTKVGLNNFKVPYFQEAISLAVKSAEEFPSKIIGWDVAITEHGPVIIEGNHNPHLGMADIAFGGLKKSNLFVENILDL
ncbi:sugar-transfer associated ATP-grasp domain-containing protein [Sporosarcina koreensis]|uniref:Sugar-transfer associated ATP-grasp domain-containing protein n=1 Tax=Sporosarcina koreensis TaxID=334735 RepID=A0ABW0U0G0_9BACL